MHYILFLIIIEMSHPFEILLRSAKAAGFAARLQKGHWDTEKELENLKGYVEQLESQLRKEGNWRVTMVMKSQSDDFSAVQSTLH